jgi:RHH-type transcriptional regulator, proline utilization regulon repressor / proline dehydrogenase / delta 1-pyrroline-5-carboxylate dehydrogenase
MLTLDQQNIESDIDRAAQTAHELLVESIHGQTRSEQRRARRLARLLGDDTGREFLHLLTDRVLRARADRVAAELARVIGEHGIPPSVGPIDRVALRGAAMAGPRVPRLVGPLVVRRILAEIRGVVLPAEDPTFSRHVARRRNAGVRLNVNVLGEAILGDDEAAARLRLVRDRLSRLDVDYVSVKISSLCANLDVLAFDTSVARIAEPLRVLYRDSLAHQPAKFVNLDMEDYRDLELTIAAFTSVLDEPEFHNLSAGIVVQAYLPDSQGALESICDWATARYRNGGAPIKVRIVKGANLATELVEAEIHGWSPAPYATKAEVDANAKRLLDIALHRPAPGALRIGIGSHNLFDVAWALTARERFGAADRVGIEMLEGMAPAMARATKARAGALLMYAPVVARHDIAAAVAYLSRRLDENSTPDNFLHAMFDLTPASARWDEERQRFADAVRAREVVSGSPRRAQDRTPSRRADARFTFDNAPDTDFTIPANRRWIKNHLAEPPTIELPPLLTAATEVDDVVARARQAQQAWNAVPLDTRRTLVASVAKVMESQRGVTLSVMAAETGKTIREGDTEVSEAVDFATYAARSAQLLEHLHQDGVTWRPHGVVLACTPWNFPYSIAAGNVLHALVAGNAVILKPAPEARGVGALLGRQLRAAGLPSDALQVIATPDDEIGQHLVTHDGVDAVLLTGSLDTARMFLDWKPRLRLRAETSGKNAIVISEAADLDLAVRDLVRSAFGHAGQKCSAASLAIVTRSVLESTFLDRLGDAVRSLAVGMPSDLSAVVGPLIAPPTGKLARALTQLDPNERWLVQPRQIDADGRLWSPGVRLGVRRGSWFHHTECFGPVLGIVAVEDLDEAIDVQNATEFGLTGGLFSLDDGEIARWLERVRVGNAYINRHITGAVVQRQPFGGWKHSSVGGGPKLGGPDYITSMVHFSSGELNPGSITRAWAKHFGVPVDAAGLRSESNVLRHKRLTTVTVRLDERIGRSAREHLGDVARLTGTPVEWSSPRPLAGIDVIIESDQQLAVRLVNRAAAHPAIRLRLLCPIDDVAFALIVRAGLTIDDTPVTGHGRVELGRWLAEQAVSETRHRHGRLQPGPAAAQRASAAATG